MHFSFCLPVFGVFDLYRWLSESCKVNERSSAEVTFRFFDSLLNQLLHALRVIDLILDKSEQYVAEVQQLGHTEFGQLTDEVVVFHIEPVIILHAEFLQEVLERHFGKYRCVNKVLRFFFRDDLLL